MKKQKCSHGEDRETCPLCGDWQNKRLREISADAVTAATMGWNEVQAIASELLLYRVIGPPEQIEAVIEAAKEADIGICDSAAKMKLFLALVALQLKEKS